MINSGHRFHGHRGLRYVYQNGQTVRGPSFAIKSLVNPHRQSYRLAVVVSRKVEKSAVARNRLRRRLYEAVRTVEDGIDGPYDMVLTVFSRDLLDEPARLLNQQVHGQLRAAGILAKRPKS
jgi:ribonuclease P protein component